MARACRTAKGRFKRCNAAKPRKTTWRAKVKTIKKLDPAIAKPLGRGTDILQESDAEASALGLKIIRDPRLIYFIDAAGYVHGRRRVKKGDKIKKKRVSYKVGTSVCTLKGKAHEARQHAGRMGAKAKKAKAAKAKSHGKAGPRRTNRRACGCGH